MQTLPLGLSTFLSYLENTTGALYAFSVLVLAPGILLFLLEQKRFIEGLTSGVEHRITVAAPGYVARIASVSALPGETKELSIRLARAAD